MADPFKTLFNPALIAPIGDRLASLEPQVDRGSFIHGACDGHEMLEVKARAARIPAASAASGLKRVHHNGPHR